MVFGSTFRTTVHFATLSALYFHLTSQRFNTSSLVAPFDVPNFDLSTSCPTAFYPD